MLLIWSCTTSQASAGQKSETSVVAQAPPGAPGGPGPGGPAGPLGPIGPQGIGYPGSPKQQAKFVCRGCCPVHAQLTAQRSRTLRSIRNCGVDSHNPCAQLAGLGAQR